MNMLLLLAWRNLWRNKRRTMITVSSVLFAVVIAIAFISYVKGMQEQLIESAVRSETGHLQIQDIQYFDEPSLDHTFDYSEEVSSILEPSADDIALIVPRIQGFSLAAKETTARPAFVTGILPEREDAMSNFSSRIVEGAMFSDDGDDAVIARGLADMLDLAVGDTVMLLGQGFQAMTAAGLYRVGGIVEFTIPERNNSMIYLPLREAQRFFAAENRLTNLILVLHDEERTAPLASAMQAGLDDEWYRVLTWDELLPDIIGVLEMRESVNKIMAWVLYMVVGFGIFGTILTMLYERMREFGILLSVGLKRRQLAFICFMETVFISLLGVTLGVVAGFALVYVLHVNPVRVSGGLADYMLEFGMEPIIAFSIAPDIFVFQGATIFAITLVVGLYVTRRIFRLDMVHAARD